MSILISLPENYNYVAVFLTLACNLKCSYCINHLSGDAKKQGYLPGEQWISLLNRLNLKKDLPLTFQGGEPTVHPDFYQIIKGLREDLSIDLLTNLQFDPTVFKKQISPERLKRDSKYSSIRVTYHPETMNWQKLLEKVLYLKKNNYSVSVFGILHPRDEVEIKRAQAEAIKLEIDFRVKDFLGIHNDKIFGSYKYANACFGEQELHCLCKTSELLIGAGGDVYRCHHDLYNQFNAQGNLAQENFAIINDFRPCERYGKCNPCDIKIKNNRFQEWGHCSVEIIDL
jgi:sulfatase maturation enzyme AslB (radical SAM superfamily)